MAEITFEELIQIPNATQWDAEQQIRIGPKAFSIRSAVACWDEACYFRFEKLAKNCEPPRLLVQIREVNQRKGRNATPYNFETISVPWDIAEKLADWIKSGPWRRPPFTPRKSSSEPEA